MRKFIILAFTLVCSFSSIIAAEYDLIIKTNSEKIEALIQEVSDTELRYKKANNPNGPMFVIKLSEVSSIVYANGEVQAIEHKAQPVQQVQPQNQQGVYGVGRGYNNYGYNAYGGYYGAPTGQVTGALQRVDNNRYMLDGHVMDGRELKYFLQQTCPVAYNYYKIWDNVEKTGWSFLGIGVPLCLIVGLPLYVEGYGYDMYVSSMFFMCFGGSLALSSVPLITCGNIFKKRVDQVYNVRCGSSQMATNLELKLNASQNGLGLALSF